MGGGEAPVEAPVPAMTIEGGADFSDEPGDEPNFNRDDAAQGVAVERAPDRDRGPRPGGGSGGGGRRRGGGGGGRGRGHNGRGGGHGGGGRR